MGAMRTLRVLIVVVVVAALISGCGGSGDSGVAVADEEADPTAGPPEPTATPEPAATPEPTATPEPPAPIPTVTEEQLAAAAAVGDVGAGEELFSQPLDGVTHSLSCSSCHSLDGTSGRNPTIVGISAVAANRIGGMSDVDYLRQAIVDPYAFKAEGDWVSAAMPYRYADLLTEEQIDDVIAFLLTR